MGTEKGCKFVQSRKPEYHPSSLIIQKYTHEHTHTANHTESETLYAPSPQCWLQRCLLLLSSELSGVFRLVFNCVCVLHIPWEGCLCTGTAWRRRRRNLLPDWPALRWQHLSSYLLGERERTYQINYIQDKKLCYQSSRADIHKVFRAVCSCGLLCMTFSVSTSPQWNGLYILKSVKKKNNSFTTKTTLSAENIGLIFFP